MEGPSDKVTLAVQATLDAELAARNSERYAKATAIDPTAFSTLKDDLKLILETYPGDHLKIREEYNKKIATIYSTLPK